MTAQEFKEKCPQYAHLEGDQLWNAMEDYLLYDKSDSDDPNVFRWQKGDPDIELSPEDEIEYQRCKAVNDEGGNMTLVNYTRVWWKAFDKQVKHDKPTSTATFMIFDVSDNSIDDK